MTTLKIYIDGPAASGRRETMMRMAELCAPSQRTGNERLCFRDDNRNLRLEIRRRVQPSLWYDLVDDADRNPEYAEQRDYIASMNVLIFVVDSQRERLEAGTAYLEVLRSAFTRLGRDPDLMPVVFQWNKRDLPGVVAESILRESFRAPRSAYIATSARDGDGIHRLITTAIDLGVAVTQK